MRTSNSPSHPTVLSRLPEWFGGLLGASGTSRGKKTAETPLEATIAAVVEQADDVEVPVAPLRPSREVQSVVDEMLSQGRYALLLRPQLIQVRQGMLALLSESRTGHQPQFAHPYAWASFFLVGEGVGQGAGT